MAIRLGNGPSPPFSALEGPTGPYSNALSIPLPAVLPAASAYNRLQAYEDAIRYRQILLDAHCADCGEIRCEQHEADERLIGQYRAHVRQLSETLQAERGASAVRGELGMSRILGTIALVLLQAGCGTSRSWYTYRSQCSRGSTHSRRVTITNTGSKRSSGQHRVGGDLRG